MAGFERARTYDADLIICDVLMPGMNGYEVTRKLKNEFSTSHIPIILLTAMGTTENKLEGVEVGGCVCNQTVQLKIAFGTDGSID